jgi:hypothetical protein
VNAIPSNWQKGTQIESATKYGWEVPGFPVVLRYSNSWTFEKPNSKSEKTNSLCIQGIVALTFRGELPDTTRGVLLSVISPDYYDGGEAYLDIDEIPYLKKIVERFSSGTEHSLEPRGDGLVGMSYRTKGMIFVRTGMGSSCIGVRRRKSNNEDVSVSELSKSDLAEILMKIDLAYQWTMGKTQ